MSRFTRNSSSSPAGYYESLKANVDSASQWTLGTTNILPAQNLVQREFSLQPHGESAIISQSTLSLYKPILTTIDTFETTECH
jgi:hypothetical protein